MMGRILFSMLFILSQASIFGQDSARTINAEQVIALIHQFHPIAKQAGLGVQIAQAELSIARAGFEPLFYGEIANKNFDQKEYYNSAQYEVKIPAWFGIEIVNGMQDLSGQNLDPSQTKGLTNYTGIEIPLLKNLILDKRRAYLKQAKLYKTMALAEQQSMLNNLMMNAMESYWTWVKNYQIYLVLNQNVQINQKRFEWVRKSFILGERAAIDTIEALAQLQQFELLKNNAWLGFQNAGLELSQYLWTKEEKPYILPEEVIPENGWENELKIYQFNVDLNQLLTLANKYHPDLQYYSNKVEVYAVEKRLKFQELLPKVSFKYHILGSGTNILQSINSSELFVNNYQFGLKAELPLLMLNGRAQFAKSSFKLKEVSYELMNKQFAIELKIKSYYNNFQNYKTQIALQSQNYQNNLTLTKGEIEKLENGESSLFLVNTRESKSLDAFEKLIDLKTKYFKTLYSMQWSAGLLR